MKTSKYFHQPNISESLGNGWYTMKKYFLWLFLATIVSGIFNSGLKYTFSNDQPNKSSWNWGQGWSVSKDKVTDDWSFQNGGFKFDLKDAAISIGIVFIVLVALAISFLVKPVFTYGANMMYVQAVRDTEPEIRWLIRGFQNNYFNIILANLLTFAIVAMGFVALIIPGIIMACRLAFVSYLVMDKNLDPIHAIEESWRMTKGHGWTIFGLGFMAIPIFILGLLCLIVGVFPALIWISASFASLYQSILTYRNTPSEGEFVYAQ